MFKFIHAADIHLDSPLYGIERYEGLPHKEIREAPRSAFEKMIQLALDEEVDFVLIAGDLYDGSWKDYRTGLFFVSQITRLADAKIPVFIIAGNHDAANKMITKSLRLPEDRGIRMFKSDRAHSLPVLGHNVVIHGQSFAQENVVDPLAIDYPKLDNNCFNIGLLHTCADEGGGRHACYAPCTINELVDKGYDYWALGHIHQPKKRIKYEEPYIVFPGNIQGRDIGETGPRGCFLVTVDDANIATPEFKTLDVIRWEKCEVDVSGMKDRDSVLDRIQEEMTNLQSSHDDIPLIVRVRLSGATDVHKAITSDPIRWVNEIRALAIAAGSGLAVEKVELATSLPNTYSSTELDGPLSEITELLNDPQAIGMTLEKLRSEYGDLARRLAPYFDRPDQPQLSDLEWLRKQLNSIQPTLVGMLLNEGASS